MSTFQPYDPNKHNNDQAGGDLNPPADGTHTGCTLTDAGAFTAKSGKDWVKLEFETTDGYKWTVLQGFASDAQAGMTWTAVGRLGIDTMEVQTLEQLDSELKPLIGGYYDLAVKTNGEFRNTYINGPTVGTNPVVQEQTAIAQNAEPVATGAGVAADDDIPF